MAIQKGYFQASTQELAGRSLVGEGIIHHLGLICAEAWKYGDCKVCGWESPEVIEKRAQHVKKMVATLLPQILGKNH